MARPTQDKSKLNVLSRLDTLHSKRSYVRLMKARGIAVISLYGLTMAENEDRIRLAYVEVAGRYFILDCVENQDHMAALQAARDHRRANPGWAVKHEANVSYATATPAVGLPAVAMASPATGVAVAADRSPASSSMTA